jgi:hypothetical protein
VIPSNDTFSTPKTTPVDYGSDKLDKKHKWTPESVNATAKQLTSLALNGQHDMVNHLVNNPGDLEKYTNSGFKALPQVQTAPLPAGQGVNPNQPIAAQATPQPLPAGQGYDPNKPLANQAIPGASPSAGDGGGTGLYRAMAYGPSQGEYTHDTLNGPLGKLQQGDLAIAPNLLSKYPLGSFVNVVDKDGNVVRSNMRVADYSYVSPNNPNSNAFELWNDQDLGHASLVAAGTPAAPQQAPQAQQPAPAWQATGIDPSQQPTSAQLAALGNANQGN